MGLVRRAALWGTGSVASAVIVVAMLSAFGALGPTYRWFVRYFPPEVWSALAAWVAVVVGIVTVFVAGRYAKQQVEKAQEQVRETQEARLAQEKQSQEALETQIRLASEAITAQAEMNQQTLKHEAEQARKVRQEQAQPNVVVFTELNPVVKQYIEIVVKNFGATPAYDVKIIADPPLRSTPNNLSGSKPYEIPLPEFPVLAPGQEWRTGWDHSPTRKNYQNKWQKFEGKSESELSDTQRLELEHLQAHAYNGLSASEIVGEMLLLARHTVVVKYRDSEGRELETRAILDSDAFKGTTWVDIKTIHNLTKLLEKQLPEQSKGLEAINRRLAEFGTEHDGVWVYGSDDDEERQYRRLISNAQAQESRESHDHLEWAMSGRNGEDPLKRPNADAASRVPIEAADIGDWFLPGDDESFELGQAWRIAFIKRHVFDDFGTVYELFRSDGDSIREREGAQIWCIRRPS